ncbi:hypothetical protein [Mycobacterium colombiense]
MPESGSEIYGAFIEAELKAENERRDSANTRAASAVTSATGLATLTLAAVGVVVGKNKDFPGCAMPFLAFALFFLLGAGACAALAGLPWRQRFVNARTLDKMLNDRRNDPPEVARDIIAYSNAVSLISLRSALTIKMRLLLTSGVLQVFAIAALAACIWAVVSYAPGPEATVPNWHQRWYYCQP